MNAPVTNLKGLPQSVTTGPIAGSRKVYTSPDGRPDIRVPFREIALDPTAREPPVRVYDPSGPYTDPDCRASTSPPACRRCASAWIATRGFARGRRRAR